MDCGCVHLREGMIHMSAPVLVPFVDFQTDGGWTKERTRRADWVGYRRGQGEGWPA